MDTTTNAAAINLDAEPARTTSPRYERGFWSLIVTQF